MNDHAASSPTEDPLGIFRPTEKFNWVEMEGEDEVPVLKAIYLPKFVYTIRNTQLLAKARDWANDGRVRLEVF